MKKNHIDPTMRKRIQTSVLRVKVSPRGGGVAISLDEWGFKGEEMSAYQNYLGGGMLGSIGSSCTMRVKGSPFLDEDTALVLDDIANNLKKYYADLMEVEYEDFKSLPVSAY